MKKNLVFPALCFSLFVRAQLLIQNVNVVPLNDSVVLMDQDVFIENGIIKDIRPVSSLPVNKKIKVIDGKGMYLMPGFADMHAHLPTDNQAFSNKEFMRLMLMSGITTVRSMRGNEDELKLRDSLRKGLMKGPDLFVSAVLPTNDSLMKGNWKEIFFKDAVAKKYDFVKYLGGIDSNEMKSVAALCKKNKLILCGHAFEGSVDKSLALGFRSIEHFQPFLKKYKTEKDNFLPAIEKFKKGNLFFCPTFSFYYVYGFQFSKEELKKRNGMQFVAQKVKDDWEKEISDFEKQQLESAITDKTKTTDTTTVREMRDKFKTQTGGNFGLALRGLKIAYDNNVKILLSADDGIYNVPGFSLYEEMKIFSSAGFSNYKIYRMATVNAAAFFQRINYTGTVTKKSAANLCLYEKNPLESLENLQTLKAVMVKGKYYWKEEL